MAKLITLDTSVDSHLSFNGSKSSFTYNLPTTLNLAPQNDGKKWMVGLQQASLYYTHPNISAQLGNNKVAYRVSGGIWKEFTFIDGIYNIQQINAAIQAFVVANGDWVPDTMNINIYPNTSYGRTIIELSNAFDLDFTYGRFRLLLGFDSQILLGGNSHISENSPNMDNGVRSLQIECSLVGNSFSNGNNSTVLMNHILKGPPGSLQRVYPVPDGFFLPIQSMSHVNQISFDLKTNTNTLWDTRGTDWSISIILERK